MGRTISVPQRAGALVDPMIYEALTRIVAGVNLALTLPSLPSQPITPSGTITPTNPVVRMLSGGTIRTVGNVDFDTPLFLIAAAGDLQLEIGGNIGSAQTVPSGSACALVQDKTTGVWWPISGGGAAASPFFVLTLDPTEYTVNAIDDTIDVGDYAQFRMTVDGATSTLKTMTRTSGTYTDGELIMVANSSVSTDLVIVNTSSPSANQFRAAGASNITLAPRASRLFRRYSSVWYAI